MKENEGVGWYNRMSDKEKDEPVLWSSQNKGENCGCYVERWGECSCSEITENVLAGTDIKRGRKACYLFFFFICIY